MPEPDPETNRRDPLGYSSKVELELVVGGRIIPLAQMGHNQVILAAPTEVPTGFGEAVLYVDGMPRRWDIEILPHEPGSMRIPIDRADNMPRRNRPQA